MAKTPRTPPRASAPLSGVDPVAPKRARHSKKGSSASEVPSSVTAEIAPPQECTPASPAEPALEIPPRGEAQAVPLETLFVGRSPSVASSAPAPAAALIPAGIASGVQLAAAGAVPLVLIAHSDPALLRLVRESMEAFLHCEVRTTSSALAAFDRVLQEPYRLLLLDLHLPGLGGEMLYDLISRAYPRVHALSYVAPPVIWLGVQSDYPRQDELTREARTKALLTLPLNIQRLLSTAATLLGRKR